jgi:hypothetical protein
MKMSDLAGKLSDQYNTISFTLQDPEAFRADVCEISNQASSSEEFHSLMTERKQQRMHEINESLDCTGFEIIANPALIGSGNWEYAIPVFRDKSLDAVVRYFAHYLPENCYMPGVSSASSSASSCYSSFDDGTSVKTTTSSVASADESGFFFDDSDLDVFTDEPLPLDASDGIHRKLKRSTATAHPESSVSSPTSSSFADDGDHFSRHSFDHDDGCSRSSGCDSGSVTSVSDVDDLIYLHSTNATRSHTPHIRSSCSEQRDSCAPRGSDPHVLDMATDGNDDDDDDDIEDDGAQLPYEDLGEMDSDETPTPKQMSTSRCSSHLDSVACRPRPSSPITSRRIPNLSHSRREGSPLQGIYRRPKEPVNRVQKVQPGSSARVPCRKLE